ncbi:MAG: ACP S-malonyltransferase [Candidatus Dasytiphilus stammeri]
MGLRFTSFLKVKEFGRRIDIMPPFAMMFPGQGSQKRGMLAEIAQNYSVIKQTFDQASHVLGYDLWHIVQHGPDKDLNNTIHTQPILITSSVALFRLWQEQGRDNPTILVGHSLGEYSALVCAGALSLEEAVCLVKKRGHLMQKALFNKKVGMIIVIGLNNDLIFRICHNCGKEDNSIVQPVIFNSQREVVIAGKKSALRRVEKNCKISGAVVLSLSSIASHCELMKPIANEFASALDKVTLQTPQLPVLNNVDVRCESNSCQIRSSLVRQLYMPVRWMECIEFIMKQGIVIFIEVGPGNVLSKIIKRNSPHLTTINLDNSYFLNNL